MDEDGELEFFNENKPKDRENCYKVVHKYYNHKGSTDFHQMALFFEGMLCWLFCILPTHRHWLVVVNEVLYFRYSEFDVRVHAMCFTVEPLQHYKSCVFPH